MFASSSFYAKGLHPTVEDQVELARRISNSLSDISNKTSKGQSMYVNRKKRSVKWVHEGDGKCTDRSRIPFVEEEWTENNTNVSHFYFFVYNIVMCLHFNSRGITWWVLQSFQLVKTVSLLVLQTIPPWRNYIKFDWHRCDLIWTGAKRSTRIRHRSNSIVTKTGVYNVGANPISVVKGATVKDLSLLWAETILNSPRLVRDEWFWFGRILCVM